MKKIPLFVLFVLCLSAFNSGAADVLNAPSIAVDTTKTPPTITITLTIDGTGPITAQQKAVIETTAANAAARVRDANAPQKDVAAAGRSAFVSALVPTLYKLVESTQKGATLSDAEVAAQTSAAKAKADADAAALIDLRPTITVK